MLWLVALAFGYAFTAPAGNTHAPAAPAAPVAPPVPAAPVAPPAPRTSIRIDAIEPSATADSEADATWLGVYAEETSEALTAQLGLKAGEGLVITYVAPDSPAAKAGLKKYDVLVTLGDQLLVHPAQLAKLIRTKSDGDTVRLAIYRLAQKQTLSATLAKRPAAESAWAMAIPASLRWATDGLTAVGDDIKGSVRHLHDELKRVGADQQRVQLELEHSMEKARRAVQEALRSKMPGSAALGLDAQDVEALTQGEANLGTNATVVVKKRQQSVQTIVQTDEAGSLVIMANPKKRLTAQDKNGKTLFDGEIETPEQQATVPAELWEKVKPLLEQFKVQDADGAKPRAEIEAESQT